MTKRSAPARLGRAVLVGGALVARRALLTGLCAALVGCGAGPEGGADPDPHDTATGVSPDTARDASADAPRDASDASRDVAMDAPRDVAMDAPRDVAMDAPRDVAMDASRDVAMDASRDVAMDAPGDASTDAAVMPPVDIDAVPWVTLGTGVAVRDLGEGAGIHAFVAYGGYGASADATRGWVTQLWRATLRDHGVRYVYAVQGPADVLYRGLEIGNSRLAMHLVPRVTDASRIFVAAHSSGTYVAHELLQQLFERGLDPAMRTWGRLVYWNLDGGTAGLDATIAARAARVWFVWARDARTGTRSPNNDSMLAGAARYPAAGGALEVDASTAGCDAGAPWCLHMTVITQRPHNPAGMALTLDYTSFDASHRVATAWLDASWSRVP